MSIESDAIRRARGIATDGPSSTPAPEAQQQEAEPEEDPLEKVWKSPPGIVGFLTTVQNGPIVGRFLTTTIAYFIIAGIFALLMRTQLAFPESDLLGPKAYNGLFTMHGSTMMFLFAVPVMEAFANLLLPPMLGARELPFPRMTAFGYYTFFFGGLLFFSSILFGAMPDAGWFAYPPLSAHEFSPGRALDFWLLGLSVAEVAAIGAASELFVATIKGRCPGMSLNRLPLFAWSIMAMALMIAFAFTPLIVATALLEFDRKIGTRFFDAHAGGDPVLWQHLFWIFGHPDVYIQFIPAAGIVSMIIPTFARRPIIGYTPIVFAILATAFISFGLWVHHMFTVGLPLVGMGFFSAASFTIGVASGVQFFAWVATLWFGRPYIGTPMLFVIGFLVTFLVGGVTGIMVAAVPFDAQVHDTYFIVAHFHYVIIGGVVFPVFAALYYWMPMMSGRALGERLGTWNFWLMFVGFHVAFFPMHISGLLGMPRRVYTYPPDVGLDVLNLISTIGAYILALGVLLFVWNVFSSLVLGRGAKPGENPWGAGTLDFAAGSPPGNAGYRVIPIVRDRYPLWVQDRLDEGPERWSRLVHEMEKRPTSIRAGLMTTALDGRPEAIVPMAKSSWWPLALSLCFLAEFSAGIFDVHWLLILSIVGMIVCTIGWHWPDKVTREAVLHPEVEEIEGVPVGSKDGIGYGWWGMLVIITVTAIAVATFLFSYYYLRAVAPVWPPPGTELPELLTPAISTAILLASAAPMWWGVRGIVAGQQSRLRLGMAVAWGMGALFLAIQLVSYLGVGIDPRDHAYGSAFWSVLGIHHLILFGALIMGAVVQLQAWLGYFSARRNEAVRNTAMLWYFLAVSWIAVAGTAYLSPRLL